MTGIGLITDTLRQLGVIGAAETPSDEDAALGLTRLNDWIDSLGTERLTMAYVLRTTKTLTASTTSYTIGTGGDINIQRPTYIDRAGLILDTTATVPVEVPLSILSDQEYARVVLKTLTSPLGGAIYYDHNWSAGLGRISVLPIPTVSTTQLVLYTPQSMATFADLVTVYTFPPGYKRFLRLGLACELYSDFPKQTDLSVIQAQFDEARANMKRANIRLEEMPMDPALTGGPGGVYNLYSDGYSR